MLDEVLVTLNLPRGKQIEDPFQCQVIVIALKAHETVSVARKDVHDLLKKF